MSNGIVDLCCLKPRDDNSPLVSVIVPSYNVEQYIDQCLTSILDNGYHNIELLVIDDRSTDGTVDRIKALMKKDKRIKLFHNPEDHNIYGGACRNIGLDHATGKYVYFCDSDDYILPGLILECVKKCESLDADICCFLQERVDALTNRKIETPKYYFREDYIFDKGSETFNAFGVKNIFTITYSQIGDKMYSKKFLDSFNSRFQELKNSNDNAFHIQTMLNAKRITYIKKVFYVYRKNTKTSVQSDMKLGNNLDNVISAIRLSKKYVEDFCKKNNVDQFSQQFCDWAYYQLSYVVKKQLNGNVPEWFYADVQQLDVLNSTKFSNLFANRNVDQPLVSVIVPCYNSEQYIDWCLNSILENGYDNIELICVDDRSTDGTSCRIEQLAEKDRRVRLYHNETDHQLYGGGCRNIGLDHARGKYVYFCDSDDFILPRLISECVRKCEQLNADICCFKHERYDGSSWEIASLAFDKKMLTSAAETFNVGSVKNIFRLSWGQVWDKFYNLGFIKKIGCRFGSMRNAEDRIFHTFSFMMAERITYIDDVFYAHRTNSATSVQAKLFTGDGQENVIEAYRIVLEKVRELGSETLEKQFGEWFGMQLNYFSRFSVIQQGFFNGIADMASDLGIGEQENVKRLLAAIKGKIPS